MGGFNSGRSGGRPTPESGLTLNLYKLIRQGLKPGQRVHGSIVWTRVGTGERVGTVGYEADTVGDCGHVRLRYTTTRAYDGEKRDSDYTIALETTPQPLGGRRWWFVCPKTGAHAGKLHLPNAAPTLSDRGAPIGSNTALSVKRLATGRSIARSSFVNVWAERAELATSCRSRNG